MTDTFRRGHPFCHRAIAVLAVGLFVVAPHRVVAQNGVSDSPPSSPVTSYHPGDDSTPAADSTLEATVRDARSKLVLGRPGEAIRILARRADWSLHESAAYVHAEALYEQGEFSEAGAAFSHAAIVSSSPERGVYRARAGEAFERAGDYVRAAAAYRRAAESLPQVAGWLGLREAGVTRDTSRAFDLLAVTPEFGGDLADRRRAELYEASGDTVAALAALTRIDRWGRAAQLALASGDLARARRFAYQALESPTRAVALDAADLLLERFPPETDDELLATGRAVSRNGRPADGAQLLEGLIGRGDSAAFTLTLYARMISAAGNRARALRLYQLAASRPEPEAADAEMERARLLITMRRRTQAIEALRAFVDKYPSHRHTPGALSRMADLDRDARRLRRSDSLQTILADAWPRHRLASRARIRLASRALSAGDSSAAVGFYRDEVKHRGDQANFARYQIAEIAARRGDVESARHEWTLLARVDSVGYYGTIARQAVELPRPYFPPPSETSADPEVQAIFEVLDLLSAVRFEEEADALIGALTTDSLWTTSQLLDIAEGLNERGRSVLGIRMGWRLTRQLTLNHPRVVRIIFPWPYRELVELEAQNHDLDPFLVAGLIRQESAFEPGATSRAGARGMMQLMPSTARWLAGRMGVEWSSRMLGVADANVHLGTSHLAALMEQYQHREGISLIASLAAYNAGGTPVRRWLRYPEARDPYLFVERIPYRETRGYVRTVLRNRELYAALYGQQLIP